MATQRNSQSRRQAHFNRCPDLCFKRTSKSEQRGRPGSRAAQPSCHESPRLEPKVLNLGQACPPASTEVRGGAPSDFSHRSAPLRRSFQKLKPRNWGSLAAPPIRDDGKCQILCYYARSDAVSLCTTRVRKRVRTTNVRSKHVPWHEHVSWSLGPFRP